MLGPLVVPATGPGDDFLLVDLFEAAMAVTTVVGPMATAVAALVVWYRRHCQGS